MQLDYSALFQNGVAIGVILFFMFMINTTLKDLNSSLQDLKITVEKNTTVIENLSDRVNKNDK